MRSLFLPLKTEYYRQFEEGRKDTEYRLAGGRWNAKTCAVGRAVTIARGYSTPDRMPGSIKSFREVPLKDLQSAAVRIALRLMYPKATDGTLIACIGIEVRK